MFTEYTNAKIFYESYWAIYEEEMAQQQPQEMPNQNSVLAQNDPNEFADAQDPAAMQQPQQMDPNAANLPNEEAEDPEIQFEPIKKLMLINKIRQLQEKLQEKSISIEELNLLLQYINFLSYDVILAISDKIVEFVNSYIKSITKEK